MKQALAQHPLPDGAALEHEMLTLWRQATHREERYAALDLLRVASHQRWITAARLPLLQELLDTDPWWDFNDEISGLALGLVLQHEPTLMKPVLRQWAGAKSLWLRHAAMLCQRSIKTGFDAVLLYDTLLPSLAPDPLATEFFIRKGMGWALRERSYQAPDEVQAFCREYSSRLSPLTVREALKVVLKRSSSADTGAQGTAAAP